MAAPAKAAKPNLAVLYDELETMLAEFSPPFTARKGTVKAKRSYALVSEKEVVIPDGRKKPEMWFASVMEQKAYVGFYFMPIYGCPDMKGVSSGLRKLLKGKACFHVTALTPELRKDIQTALKAGLAGYKKLNWV